MATATYIPIATQTLGSAASSITFSSIPSTYTDLRLVLTGTTNNSSNLAFQFNGDSGSNYSYTFLSGTGSTVISSSSTNAARALFESQGASSTTIPTMYTLDVFSYANAANKSCLVTASVDQNGSGAVETAVALWRSTASITSISIFCNGGGNLLTNSTATLWGI